MNPIYLERVVLDAWQVQQNLRISGEIFGAPAELTTYLTNDVFPQIELRFNKYIASQTLHKREVKYPSNWREAFKERFAPGWYLKRSPVKYTHITLEAKALYPDIALPKERNHIVLFKQVETDR